MSVFVDTNVLIYLRDPAFPDKAEKARAWMTMLAQRNEAVVSPQVVNEFVSVSLRRFKSVTVEEVHSRARELAAWCRAPLDMATCLEAMVLHRFRQLSWWDAVLVAAALRAGCRYLLSEDMKPGARFGDLTIVNPFETEPDSIFEPT